MSVRPNVHCIFVCARILPPLFPMTSSLDCVIIEDDPIDRELLSEYVERHDHTQLLWAVESAEAAEDRIIGSSEEVDVILLDIQLPGRSGFEMVRDLEADPAVIIITSEARYAVQAFDIDAAHFLVKPVSYERFDTALSRAEDNTQLRQRPAEQDSQSTQATRDQTIFVNTGDQYKQISLTDILYLESDGNYVRIHVEANRPHLVRLTLKRAEELLPTQCFVRVHRSYLVRIDKIENFVDWSVVIDGEVIPVSKSYRDSFREALPTLE